MEGCLTVGPTPGLVLDGELGEILDRARFSPLTPVRQAHRRPTALPQGARGA
jgi:hypothetical protein